MTTMVVWQRYRAAVDRLECDDFENDEFWRLRDDGRKVSRQDDDRSGAVVVGDELYPRDILFDVCSNPCEEITGKGYVFRARHGCW